MKQTVIKSLKQFNQMNCSKLFFRRTFVLVQQIVFENVIVDEIYDL